ncbi:hypothetical protein B551_0206930 [Cupriavidus sp. HPC(L)]|nr:hypothetical protein B551_0206930 [Cupriavidus sp. HPC(L)]
MFVRIIQARALDVRKIEELPGDFDRLVGARMHDRGSGLKGHYMTTFLLLRRPIARLPSAPVRTG